VKVLCVGIATFDHLLLVEKFPEKDERVISIGSSVGFGGPAATAAVTLARLGISSSLAAVIGDDEDGKAILKNLKSEGVDTSLVSIDPSVRTKTATIIISKSEQTRAILVQLSPVSVLTLDRSQCDLFDWVHCDHEGVVALQNANIHRAASPRLSIDLGYFVQGVTPEDFDLFAPSDRVMRELYPDVEISESVSLLARNANNKVVVAQGSTGAYFADSQTHGLVPAMANQIVSTLGAGDVFHGALLASQIWGTSLQTGTAIANITAGISCQALDGQSGILRKADLLVELKERGISI
jgi:sulfofructose kinase